MTEQLEPIHDDDNVTLQFTVAEGGAAVDITGATIVAKARSLTSSTLVTLSTSITNGAGGVFVATIAPGDLTTGPWQVQALVTLASGEAQTPLDRFLAVRESF